MSDTPRTDHEYGYVVYGSSCDKTALEEISAFARQLERELNAANQIAKKYEDRYFASLDRIKRLEEAGDFMSLCLTKEEPFRSSAKEKWNKAKEAKP